MSYDLGTAHGKIELDYDSDGAADRADEDVKRIGDSSDKSDKKVRKFGESLSGFASTMGKVAKGAAIGAAGIMTLVHSAQLIAGTLAALAPIAGAALGALPGLIAGGVAAMAVLKVATAGVGKVLKLAGGDAEQFNEALEKLSPQAQAFAQSIRGALQALKPMQQAMQDAFFSGLGPQVTRIATGLGSLRGAAVGVANAFNALAKEALGSIKDIQFEQIEATLLGVQQFLRGIAGGIKPVIQGFLSLAAQASDFSGRLGEGVGGALTKLGNAMQNFDLKKAFEDAMVVIRPLGEILSNIGSIAKSVFGGLTTDAGGALGVFGELTGKLAEFLKSAEGQQALQALGEALSTISGAAGQVFLTLLQQLAPIIVALAPGIADLALQLASILVPALEAAGPLLESLAGFLSDNSDVVGPLVIAIGGLAIASKAFAAGQAIANAAVVVWSGITKAAAIATNVWSAAQWLLNVAMTANPIGLIILAVVALIAIIVLIATKTTWFQDLWKVVWTAIKDAAKAVADWFMNTIVPSFKKAWEQLQAAIKFVVDFLIAYFKFWMSVWQAIFDGIKKAAQAWWNGVSAIFNGIKTVLDKVAGFFKSLKDSIVARLGEAVTFVKGIPGKILGALGNLGSKLYEKGKEFVRGFIDGIGSMVNAAVNKVRSLVDSVMAYLPGSPAKKGPLSGRGWTPYRGKALVEGFAEGIERNLSLVSNLGVKIAAAVTPVVPTALGTATAGAPLALVPSPAPRAQAAAAGDTVTIGSLTVQLQGVWDMTDPTAARKIAAQIHEAIENFKKGYR